MGYGVIAIIGVLAAAASATAQVQQGNAQKKMYQYQAEVGEANKKAAEYQARDSEARGDIEAQQYRKKVLRFASSQRAVYAGAGIQVDSGTPIDMLDYTYKQGDLDVITIKHNAALEAWGIRQQGSNYSAQSAMSRAAGVNAQQAGYFDAGTTLLNSAGSTAMWFNRNPNIRN